MAAKQKIITFAAIIVLWCNGSTTGFGSVCGGSNPPRTTFKETLLGSPFLFILLQDSLRNPDKGKIVVVRIRLGQLKRRLERASVFVVCSARALSNGCKSRVSPNSGNYIAKGKGVHRELESERSRRQTSDLTDRNFIQGILPWVRLQYKPKPYSYSEWLV